MDRGPLQRYQDSAVNRKRQEPYSQSMIRPVIAVEASKLCGLSVLLSVSLRKPAILTHHATSNNHLTLAPRVAILKMSHHHPEPHKIQSSSKMLTYSWSFFEHFPTVSREARTVSKRAQTVSKKLPNATVSKKAQL